MYLPILCDNTFVGHKYGHCVAQLNWNTKAVAPVSVSFKVASAANGDFRCARGKREIEPAYHSLMPLISHCNYWIGSVSVSQVEI